MRARMSPHITLNPYSTQLVDNINRMMTMSNGHVYQVAMSPQLSQLTNTLKKKKCVGGHSGPCQHSRTMTPVTQSDSSVRSDSLTPSGQDHSHDTESEILPHTSLMSQDVVFRAVSPHGHVYWEIDPKRPNKLAGARGQVSDEDSQHDLHNMSDFSEDDASKIVSDRSRQSSSRFSDHRPLLSSSSPCHVMQPLPETIISQSPVLTSSYSPTHRFSSLQKAAPQVNNPFPTRTRLQRTQPRQQQQQQQQQEVDQQHFQYQDMRLPEQVQQQVQIPDLRRLPVSVKSSEYIMAKIQNHMNNKNNSAANTRQGREV